ncbi:hypothetical protein BLNAU_10673 [Blattamonas nauphoetae]|uniref:Protein kinase domain-containing protein n=1 Tax=Blattamonas nauphoetae TaxID=2049346 RepID=A0ABQ9XSY9_9EUKA|nr:hypothetical protein BLNAU_10673 [Blattamonas nauphoetae]
MLNHVFLLFTGVAVCLSSSISPSRLSSILNSSSDFSNWKQFGILSISLPEGILIGDNFDMKHMSLELSGERSKEKSSPGTHILPQSESDCCTPEENVTLHTGENCIFSLTNSTLSLESLHFTLLADSKEPRKQLNEERSNRLAIVSGSMLTISESTIVVSTMTSAILISPSKSEESSLHSSVVVRKCSISNEIGQLRGLVETEAFPAFGGSRSVLLVGCSFSSQEILGTDGIGLSLTRSARKNNDEVGVISSSLISCSFVNMSSIGCSRPPHVSELSQTMLGCVVWLSSSHLSGSTIRDVNNGGSVLCSNTSFSSLLSSPNTDSNPSPSIILDGDTPLEYEDGKEYFFDYRTVTATSVSFSYCRFTGGENHNIRPLTFNEYPGTISILSCCFTDIANTKSRSSGGAVFVYRHTQFDQPCFTATSSNFTHCSALDCGGGMDVQIADDCQITSCRFEHCSTNDEYSGAGGLYLHGNNGQVPIPQFELVDCVFADCTATFQGGGICVNGVLDLSVVNTRFEHCELLSEYDYPSGGGLGLSGSSPLTVEWSHFIECSCAGDGGALYFNQGKDLSRSRMFCYANNVTKFTDVAIMCNSTTVPPTLKFENCFTTVSSDSSGMIINGSVLESGQYDPIRHLDPEFERTGPLLTAKPTVRMNKTTGKMILEMEGKTPLTSQEYEVTVEDSTGKETELRMLFLNGTGTLVAGSEVNLSFNTSYTITSIVGVVSESSSSQMTNGITAPVATWAFNIVATPDFLTLTIPDEPSITTPEIPSFSSLLAATAHLIESDPKSAFVVLLFDQKVCGSYDFVILEEGKPVTLTITAETLTHPRTQRRQESFVCRNEETAELADSIGCVFAHCTPPRHSLKNAEPARKEMEAQEPFDVEKVEEYGVDSSNGVILTDANSHSAFWSSNDHATRMNRSEEVMDSLSRKEGELVEVMWCSGDFALSTARMDKTLYSVLHIEHREIGKRAVGIQILNGLKHVAATRGRSDVLTHLSSHWVLMDATGNAQLKLQMNASEAEQEAAQTQSHPPPLPISKGNMDQPADMTRATHTDKSGMDGLRWRAPEIVASEGRSGEVCVDGSKASVFSLGLVLWEIETGQVPFGELDAVNAQRQSRTGIGPKMEDLKNEEFVSLIRRCVSVDPKQLPTLSEIGEFLSSHPENTSLAFGKELKGP